MPTSLRFAAVPGSTPPPPPVPRPSLIHWPVVAGASACAVVLLACTLVAAWFACRPAKTPRERPAPLATAVAGDEAAPVNNPADEPAPPPVQPAPTPVAEQPAAQEPSEPTPPPVPTPPACETFGTRVQFVSNPTDAGRLARQDNKLLFVLHISGNFEDDKFT